MSLNGFNYLLGGFFLSEFGRTMYFVTITWLLYEITSDPLYTGLLLGLGFVPGFVLNLFLGVMVDRYNRKKLTLVANAISSIAILFLLVFLSIFVNLPWVIITVHMVLQVCGSLFRPAIQAFMAENFEEELLPTIFSKASSTGIIGGLVGALVGGIVISKLSTSVTLLIVSMSLLLSSILLFMIKSKKRNPRSLRPNHSIQRDIVDGFHYVKSNKLLLGLFVIMFTGQLVYHSSLGFLSVYTVTYLMRSATIYGILDATIAAGGIFAGLIGTWWWNTGKNKLAIYSLMIVFVGLVFVGFASSLAVVFIGVFLIGLGTTWIRVLLQSLQQMVTEPNYHGRMASFRMIANQGAVVFAAPVLGWLATTYSANVVYLSLLIPVSLCLIFAVFQSKQKQLTEMMNRVA